jgi:hypothetical protein
MFHNREIAADRQRRNMQAQKDMQIDLSERRMRKQIATLHAPDGQVEPITAASSALELQQLRMRAAQATEGRVAQNALRGAAMQAGTLQLRQIEQVETSLGDAPSLNEQGRAHLARAGILKENAFELNRIAHDTQAPGEAMMARRAAQSSLAGAIGEEMRGVASIEGRSGIAARSGLEGDDLDALVARSGIKPILDQHAAENIPKQAVEKETPVQQSTQDPAAYWTDLEARLEPETFDLAVARFRDERINELYGASGASPETKATFNAMRKMHGQAQEAGPTSGQALRLNQKLVADLPEGSDERKAMVAIRSIALERRKRERQADDTARS